LKQQRPPGERGVLLIFNDENVSHSAPCTATMLPEIDSSPRAEYLYACRESTYAFQLTGRLIGINRMLLQSHPHSALNACAGSIMVALRAGK
jgi:hypothetical protein